MSKNILSKGTVSIILTSFVLLALSTSLTFSYAIACYEPSAHATQMISSAIATKSIDVDGLSSSGFQQMSTFTLYQLTLTTIHADDFIVVVFNDYNFNSYTSYNVQSIKDSSNLVWHSRVNTQCTASLPDECVPSIFYAVSSKKLTNDVVTLTTVGYSTEYQLTIFAMHGLNAFDNNPTLPSIGPYTPGTSSAQVSMKDSKGGEVVLAYYETGHTADLITYPTGYYPITPITGNWFYIAFKVLGDHQTHTVTSWSLSAPDPAGSMAIDDAMV